MDALFNLIGGFSGAFLGAALVAWLTQRLIEGRERRDRRDRLRLELYPEVVDLVLDNELPSPNAAVRGDSTSRIAAKAPADQPSLKAARFSRS
jgi:hypothetical protein